MFKSVFSSSRVRPTTTSGFACIGRRGKKVVDIFFIALIICVCIKT